jgi:hypothetical protein
MTRYLILSGAHAMDHVPGGTVSDGPRPEATGGLAIVGVPSREEAVATPSRATPLDRSERQSL